MALMCGCSVPATERLDLSAKGSAQLIAPEAGKSILCREEWRRAVPNDFGEDLFYFCPLFVVLVLHYCFGMVNVAISS